ncbi:MAG: hypothetical protein OQK46_02620 [Gammaproteobacteria bacterium]|nr:hypothetical protein [Gammaproteobacteria bacterium]
MTLNKIKQISISLAFASLMSFQPACATTSCVYDNTYFKPARYTDNKLVSNLNYNKADNTAQIITSTGNLISIQHWACNHHGLHAVMLVGPYPSDDKLDIKQHINTLANIVLDKEEAQILKSFISKKDLVLTPEPVTLNINNKQYDEFYITYASLNDSIIIEIKIYKS